MMSNKKIIIGAAALAVIVVCCVFTWSAVSYRFSSATKSETILYIPSNATFNTIIDSLNSSHVLKNEAKFLRLAHRHDLDENFNSGRYVIKEGDTYASIIRRISIGMQSPVKVIFNNIRTIDRLAAIVSRTLESDSATFMKTFTNDSITGIYGFDPATIIAMFIPNTYELYWNTSAEKFVQKMNKEYEKFWNNDRKNKLKRLQLSQTDAITLASIVYEETKMSNEMARVAGVYVNRLRRKMPLQADPTVKFTIGDFTLRRVLTKHLTYDSPYNTYLYAGLPPGAICMPSIKAIDAVLDYEDHKYIYFCAKADFSGCHSFATTLNEHLRNAQAYSRALNKLKIYK